ncbi:hypothetical protein KY290_003866 [Solanum tuberosum]|uniref:Uncharacterized protein n=1 Tax=Solanum tuberosum TaxID=4113 RepID=A0ABQ7WU31_SOLTU|nr:hypothetical protein KY290_003866 [Solanum tuberosum]
MEDMNVDLLFHHGVKQVLVKGPSGNLFLVQDSDGIKILQELLTEAFGVVHVFVVDDYEEIVFAPNIINHSEIYHVQCPGHKLKTFKQEHNCEEALHNPRATTNTLSHYFKSKVQNNPKYCARHVEANWMKRFRTGEMKKLMWLVRKAIFQFLRGRGAELKE